MKKIRITVKKIARYDDLIARYEKPDRTRLRNEDRGRFLVFDA